MANKLLKILVVGCGSIGRRHIRLLKEMGVEVTGCDQSDAAREWVETNLQVGCNQNVAACLVSERYGGAIIATPNHLHREPAIQCMLRSMPVLIEKPIAHTAAEADHILWDTSGYETGEGEEPTILVGYCLRFHPGLRRVKELIDSGAIGTVRHASIHFGSYLPDWRPGTDYRTNYAASRETGGGILMDASHELDYACWLFGRPVSVSCVMQNSGALEIQTEDIADLVMRFESGAQANIHLDYLSREPGRGCDIVGDKGTVHLGIHKASYGIMNSQDGTMDMQPFDLDDMYRAELKHFLACIWGEEKPLVTGEDGIRALQIAEAAYKSSTEGRVICL